MLINYSVFNLLKFTSEMTSVCFKTDNYFKTIQTQTIVVPKINKKLFQLFEVDFIDFVIYLKSIFYLCRK